MNNDNNTVGAKMNMPLTDISEKLRDHDISPSLQRMEIYKYLVDENNHPTVDMIFNSICQIIPALSRTTVYNTLKLFVEKGLVSEVMIDKTELRYDAVVQVHGHFLSEKTGEIHDVDVDLSGLNPDFLGNADVKEHHIYFKGDYRKEKRKKKS
mgnify:CR=1 FL=1